MELLEFKQKLFEMLKIQDPGALPEALDKACGSKEIKEKYISTFGLDRDWIRELYQYYCADRKDMKQDFTPESLARLVTKIIGPCDTVNDICAGSGSLSLYLDPDTKIRAYEMDDNVIPFLRFNCFIHGMQVEINHCNALEAKNTLADGVVSNPPFNIDYSGPLEAKTGNWAFVLKALQMTRGRAAIILPCGVLSERKDLQTVKELVENGKLEAVIKCPEKMFASTSIPVCVLVLNALSTSEIVMIDASELADKEIREQKGQYGEKSHTGRVYKKTFNVFSEEAISDICNMINSKIETDFSTVQTAESIRNTDYQLNPARYLASDDHESDQTKLEWVAEQYNQIIRMKNACKLIVNETLAKQLGIDQQLWEQSKANSLEVQKMIEKVSGIKLEKEDYLTFTKSRELSIRFKSKEELPAIFNQFIQLWINQTVMLNQMENAMLGQMRDYLLPQLLSGDLEI